ncbi:MAG: matrixin family metalloprotease, partial [Ignavibacteriales bacterium]
MKTFQKLMLLLLFSLFLVPLNLYSQYEYCDDNSHSPCFNKPSSRYTLGGTHLSKTHLKYFIGRNEHVSYDVLRTGFLMAFNTWSNEVPFTCEEVSNENEAFLKIHAATYAEFCTAIGGESFAVALSWPPPMTCNGLILLNYKNFVLDFNVTPLPKDPIDLVHTLIHEIGHTFGLCHSNQTSSVMYEEEGQPTRTLSQDDKNGIHEIYNAIVTVQNNFENPDKTFSVGGGIVSVDDHDYLTDNLPNKGQKFP